MDERETALFLGIDAGTQSARAGVFTAEGVLVSSASASYATTFPQPGWAEQDPADWWRAICTATRDCLRTGAIQPARVRGISFDATSSTVLRVDREGRPLGRAILWMDQRAAAEAEQIAATGHPVLRYVGGRDSAEWMLPKALWLKHNAPAEYAAAWKIVEATDWIAFMLTGRWTASLCNATCKWNYCSVEGGWQRDFFYNLGASELLDKWPQDVVAMGEPIGGLTSAAAADLGLQSGTPVAEGGIDAHVGLLGLNALSTGRMALILGTSSVMFALNDRPVFSERLWGPYPDAILKGTWLLEAGQTSSGAIVNWLVENLGAAAGGAGAGGSAADRVALLARLEEEAMSVPPGSNGLVLLDYWQGNRTPRRDPHARGMVFGLTLAHDYRHLVRSVYEGIVFGTKHIVDCMREDGVPVTMAAAGGGGVKSRIWLQLTADICGIPITVPRAAESCGVLGSAVLAACGAGRYSSLQAASAAMVADERVIVPSGGAEAYAESYATYLRLYESTRHLLERQKPPGAAVARP